MTGQGSRGLIEVMRNRFQAIANEMAAVILRTGHTLFVKETGDFGAALASVHGEVFAAALNVGVTAMVGLPMAEVLRRSQVLGEHEGDVFIANDPAATRGMATHLSDVFLWKPIFHDDRPLCYAVGFIHASDVGGRVPGSIAPSNRDIYQEGLRIPPMRLLSGGTLNQEFLELFSLNVRTPDHNWGDLKAVLAALNTAEERMRRLIARYGGEQVDESIVAVLDYGEAEARAIIERVPDGTYTFWDYLEGDHVGEGLVRIHLALQVEGSSLTLNFTETDPQVRFAVNIPTYSRRGHWMIALGVINWLRSVAPEITYNAGLVRPIALSIPQGSLLNPDETAPVGARSATMFRVAETFLGALGQAIPDVLPAAGSGQVAILVVSAPDARTGEIRVNVAEPLCGGSGARPTQDGIDGVDFLMSFLRNIPVESLESEMPGLLVRRYGLRPDSGGPGRWRGGHGVELELEILSPEATITARGMERYRLRPWGRRGGRAGTQGRTLLNPGTSDERDLGKLDILLLERGDVFLVATQGGGGYGDPMDRDPERVLEDVRNGLVSLGEARDAYGVIIHDQEVDVESTASLRAQVGQGSPSVSPFDFGWERSAYEEIWPPELRSALNRLTFLLPKPLRPLVRARLMARVEARRAEGLAISKGDLQQLLVDVFSSLGLPDPRCDPANDRPQL